MSLIELLDVSKFEVSHAPPLLLIFCPTIARPSRNNIGNAQRADQDVHAHIKE